MDKKIKELLQTLEGAQPPEGMRARVLQKILPQETVELNRFQQFLYASPLRAAGLFSIAFSGLLWAIFGASYPAMLTAMLTGR